MFLGFFWDLNQWPLDGKFKLSPSKFNKTAKTPVLLSLHWGWNLTPMFRSQTIRHHQNRHHKDNTIDCKVSCHSLIHSECEFYRLNEFNDIICFSAKPGHTQRFVILEPTLERLAKVGGDHTGIRISSWHWAGRSAWAKEFLLTLPSLRKLAANCDYDFRDKTVPSFALPQTPILTYYQCEACGHVSKSSDDKSNHRRRQHATTWTVCSAQEIYVWRGPHDVQRSVAVVS